jgi:hypothetical protein
MNQRIWTILASATVAILGAATAAHAEDAATMASNMIQSELGAFVYPKGDQDATAQANDTVDCYNSAQQRTGIDLKAPPPVVEAAPTHAGGALKGAARGAARGAAIGAIAGDTSKGASIGAAGGAMRGRQQKKQAHTGAEQQAAQQTADAVAERKATFNRAFGACMDARNYSVK